MIEQDPTTHSGSERSPERNVSNLEGLAEALGYVETEELQQLRAELIAAMQSGQNIGEQAARYQSLAETLANQRDSEMARLGYDIAWALIRCEGGRDYVDELEVASMHALQMGLDGVVDVLDQEIADAELSEA